MAENIARKVLGTLLLYPELIESTEDLTENLFYGRDKKVFQSIALLCQDHPKVIDLKDLSDMVGGENVLTYLDQLMGKPEELYSEPSKFVLNVGKLIEHEQLVAQNVRGFINYDPREFSLRDVYHEFHATTEGEQNIIRQVIFRMKEGGDIVASGKGRGHYRTVDKKLDEVDLMGTPPEPMDLYLPLWLDKLVKIFPKSIIVCAGTSNQGKTALAHDFAKGNMDKHDVRLFFCEGGQEGLQDRLGRHADKPLAEWKVKAYHRIDNFEDVIFPDSINIVDYLGVTDEFWKVSSKLDGIYRKLGKGIAWVNIQKGTGAEMGRGGDFGLERPQLYITLSRDESEQRDESNEQFCVAKILKSKSYRRWNPDGKSLRFSVVDGWQIKHGGHWGFIKKEPKEFHPKKVWS